MCSFHYTTLATIFQLICGFEVASSSKFRLPQIRLMDGEDACEGRVEVRLQRTGDCDIVCVTLAPGVTPSGKLYTTNLHNLGAANGVLIRQTTDITADYPLVTIHD